MSRIDRRLRRLRAAGDAGMGTGIGPEGLPRLYAWPTETAKAIAQGGWVVCLAVSAANPDEKLQADVARSAIGFGAEYLLVWAEEVGVPAGTVLLYSGGELVRQVDPGDPDTGIFIPAAAVT